MADLKNLRERGLTRLRDTRLDALETAVALYRHDGPAPDARPPVEPYRPAAVEELLRQAIVELGGGKLSTAAGFTFGLAAGARDWTVGERRKSAASIYGVSTERFRKHHEQLIVDQTAEAVLRLCMPAAAPRAPRAADVPPSPAVIRLGRVTLDYMPVEMIKGVDAIVSSENVYLEASKIFRNSLSAALRRACAETTGTGEIVDDVVQRGLADWMRDHGRPGLPVAPGTVATTSPGRLRASGVRRIYHAAVAVPVGDGNEYELSPEAVARAVHNTVQLAQRERPPLRSIALPLFGAGRGGLDAAESLSWVWSAVERELDADPSWDMHLIARSPATAQTIIRHFSP
ncbi:macro domain-containing protein [Actinomadura soli]|uniref:macro domain-containing protein n=1 Tax=Actinomadura soli TaxID=2508997 RepID=UPI00197AF557|nr:macro domain-containing protein [Actinomadura soli]